ncbi:MAG: metal ABC transporter solute-binding protein, Zn/Mn family [Candidatus Woesearchaeota archaeon]
MYNIKKINNYLKILKKITIISVLVSTILFSLMACSTGSKEYETEDKIVIVTTLYPLYEFAKQVGGENVETTLLLPPGAEAHTFEPKPSDIRKINSADIFIFIGEDMEPWAHDILEGINNPNLKIIDTSSFVNLLDSHDEYHDNHEIKEIITNIEYYIHEWEDNIMTSNKALHEIEEIIHHFLENDHHEEHDENDHEEHNHDFHEIIKIIDKIIHEWEDNIMTSDDALHEIEEIIYEFLEHEYEHHEEHDHHHGEYDPHFWLDFENNKLILHELYEVLSAIDSENNYYYLDNAIEYMELFDELDKLYTNSLTNCKHSIFITGGHDSFRYLASRYNLEVKSAYGLSPNAEPTPQTLRQIVDLTKENDIKYIYFEKMVNPRMAQTIAQEVGAEILVLNPGHNLMQDEIDQGITFIDLMKENLDNLEIGLECNNE